MNPYAAIFAAIVVAVAGYQVARRTDKAGATPTQAQQGDEAKKEGGAATPFLDQLFGGQYAGSTGTNSFDTGYSEYAGVDYSDTGPSAAVPITTTRPDYISSQPKSIAMTTPSGSGPLSAHNEPATGYGGKLGVRAV